MSLHPIGRNLKVPVFNVGLIGACALLAACATAERAGSDEASPSLVFAAERFGDRPPVIEPADIFALTESQAQAFLEFFDDPTHRHLGAHERVMEYLDRVGDDFDFHSDTRTASAALETHEGNCLTLAILTTALADLAGVEVGYQLVDSAPVFELTGSVVSKGVHVRSILYDPSWTPPTAGGFLSVRPGIRVDYFPDGTERFAGNLSYPDYLAMYYSNVGGEALADGDLDTAFWYALESLAVSPDNVAALNTIAVVYRQAGDDAMAETVYRYGIDKAPRAVSLLRNYRILLTRQGRSAEADAIEARLSRLHDLNPFDWIVAGRQAYFEGEYREAIGHYRRAAEKAPYLHEAYHGMALAYLKLGDAERAETALRRALENSRRQATTSRYQAELAALAELR